MTVKGPIPDWLIIGRFVCLVSESASESTLAGSSGNRDSICLLRASCQGLAEVC